MASEYTLQRPRAAFPPDASLLGYEFSELLITALNQGCLVSYLGWYVDDPKKGPVWHRFGKGEETPLAVSLIVSVYALWVAGFIDVTVRARDDVFLARAEHAREDSPSPHAPQKAPPKPYREPEERGRHELPPLEQDILGVLDKKPRLRARELVESLPFPSKRRGIGAWFFSGSPSGRSQGKEGWFTRASSFHNDAPMWVQEALDLAKALVILEAGTDVSEPEHDRRDEATYVIETEIAGALQKLL